MFAVFIRLARWRPSRGEARAIGLALGVKTLVMAAMLLFSYNFLALDAAFDLRAYFADPQTFTHHHYTRGLTPWYLPLAHWDGQHYLLLSDYGYTHGYDHTSGQQFWPLYPMLIRALSTFMPRAAAAVLLTYLFMAGFALFLYRIAVAYRCRRPLLPVLMMMTFPTAFFTAVIYTEPLFLFLLAGFFWHFFHTRRRVYLLYFALLPLARGSAVFVFGALALAGAVDWARALLARRREMQERQDLTKRERRKQRHVREEISAPAAAIPWSAYAHCVIVFTAGACAYLAFFYFATGDALAGLTAQRRYGHDYSIFYLLNPLRIWEVVSGGKLADEWFGWTYARWDYSVMWLMFAGAAFIVYKREWRLLCFYFPLFYSQAGMSPLTSFSRYALSALPFLAIAVAKHARHGWQAALVYALCAAAFAVQLYLAARFSVNDWVG